MFYFCHWKTCLDYIWGFRVLVWNFRPISSLICVRCAAARKSEVLKTFFSSRQTKLQIKCFLNISDLLPCFTANLCSIFSISPMHPLCWRYCILHASFCILGRKQGYSVFWDHLPPSSSRKACYQKLQSNFAFMVLQIIFLFRKACTFS